MYKFYTSLPHPGECEGGGDWTLGPAPPPRQSQLYIQFKYKTILEKSQRTTIKFPENNVRLLPKSICNP